MNGLDNLEDTLVGYHSPTHGRRPVVRGHRDSAWDQVREWVDAGVEPHAFGVAAAPGEGARTSRGPRRHPDVRVDTMHFMKGMEFHCVLVARVDAVNVPSSGALSPREEDPVAHEQDPQRERCLLFVASTRARDALRVSYSGSPSQFIT